MLKRYSVSLVVFFVAIFALSGCKIPEKMKLRCSATVLEAFADGVDSGAPVEVEVVATGGEAPYYMLGVIGTFNPSTTISRSYTNNTDADITIDDVALVNDNLGFTAQCDFAVVVHPKPVDDPDPSLALVATPSDSVPNDQSITVTATATELGDSPTFTFEYSEDGIAIDQDGNSAEFFVTDGEDHDFEVIVKAEGNGLDIEETITLNFADIVDPVLACDLSHDAGDYKVGDSVPFTVTAATGEALEITAGSPGTDGSVEYLIGSIFGVSYSSIGTKVVSVKARSADTGVECNSGATLYDTVTIDEVIDPTPPTIPELYCEAFTDGTDYRVWYGGHYPNWDGQLYNSVVAWAEPVNGIGDVSIVDVDATGDPDGHYYTYNNDPLAKEIFFYEAGWLRITLTVQDEADRTAVCTTDYITLWW